MIWNQPQRHETRNKNPCNQPLIIDDYGDAVYLAHYAQRLVWPDESTYAGAIVPQVNQCYVDAKDPTARKASVKAFDESERNCNTCLRLNRIPHAKDQTGFLHGECESSKPNHPYKHRFKDYGHMIFHPEDWMGMICWQPRGARIG